MKVRGGEFKCRKNIKSFIHLPVLINKPSPSQLLNTLYSADFVMSLGLDNIACK